MIRIAVRFRIHVEPVGVEPARTAGNLVSLHTIRQPDQALERHARRSKSSARREPHAIVRNIVSGVGFTDATSNAGCANATSATHHANAFRGITVEDAPSIHRTTSAGFGVFENGPF